MARNGKSLKRLNEKSDLTPEYPPEDSTNVVDTSGTERRARPSLELLAVLAVLVFLFLRLFSVLGFHPSTRLWGINFPAYLSDKWYLLPLLLLPSLALHPAVSAWLIKSRGSTPYSGNDSKRGSLWIVLVGTVLMVGSTFVFRTHFPFLGDGAFCLSDLFRTLFLNDHHPMMIVKPSSVLTGLIVVWIMKLLRPENLAVPYQVLGTLGMFLVAFIGGLMLRRIHTLERILLISFGILSPGILLFYSYVELYTLQYAFIILSLFAAWLHYRLEISPGYAMIFFVLALATGLSSVILIPAFFWMVGRSVLIRRWGEQHAWRMYLALLVLTVIGALSAVLFMTRNTADVGHSAFAIAPSMVEGLSRENNNEWMAYTMLAPEHLADIGNQLLLVGGPLALIVVLGLAFHSSRIRFSSLLQFSLLVATGGLMALLCGQSYFGMARDWDLMLVPGGSVAFFGIALLVDTDSRPETIWQRILPGLLAITMLTHSLFWLIVNFTPVSAARLDHLLKQNEPLLPAWMTQSGLENLRKYYSSATGMPDNEKYRRTLRQLIDCGYEPEIQLERYIDYVTYTATATREAEVRWLTDKMAAMADETIPRDSYRYVGRERMSQKMASLLLEIGTVDWELLRDEFARHRRLFMPTEVALLSAYTDREHELPEILERTRGAVGESTMEPSLFYYYGRVFEMNGISDTAIQHYEHVLSMAPSEYPYLYFHLSDLYSDQIGDTLKAIETLQRFQATCPLATAAEHRQAEEQIRRLSGPS
ncbi:MAG: hypothetical protein JXA28_01045 [Bacteroidetes bacterium]|nr:hypothetical protein [Bacteroidota bacterium]